MDRRAEVAAYRPMKTRLTGKKSSAQGRIWRRPRPKGVPAPHAVSHPQRWHRLRDFGAYASSYFGVAGMLCCGILLLTTIALLVLPSLGLSSEETALMQSLLSKIQALALALGMLALGGYVLCLFSGD
jgi:hypothetical protein